MTRDLQTLAGGITPKINVIAYIQTISIRETVEWAWAISIISFNHRFIVEFGQWKLNKEPPYSSYITNLKYLLEYIEQRYCFFHFALQIHQPIST